VNRTAEILKYSSISSVNLLLTGLSAIVLLPASLPLSQSIKVFLSLVARRMIGSFQFRLVLISRKAKTLELAKTNQGIVEKQEYIHP